MTESDLQGAMLKAIERNLSINSLLTRWASLLSDSNRKPRSNCTLILKKLSSISIFDQASAVQLSLFKYFLCR